MDASETRADAARRAMLVAAKLADCAHMAQYIANACADGVKHASEAGANPRYLRDANEIKARLEALVDFVDAGRSYLAWDASQ